MLGDPGFCDPAPSKKRPKFELLACRIPGDPDAPDPPNAENRVVVVFRIIRKIHYGTTR